MFATCHWLFMTCQFFQDHQFNFLLFTLHICSNQFPATLRRCFTTSQLANHRWIQGFWVLMPINTWRRQPSSHSPVVAPRVIWSISRTKSFSLFGEELPCCTTFFALLVSQDGFRYEALQGGMGRIVPTAVWLPGILVSTTTSCSRTWRAEMACLSCTKRSDVWEKQMICGAKSTSAFHKPSWRCEGKVERWGPARWKDHGQRRVSILHLKIRRLLAKPS